MSVVERFKEIFIFLLVLLYGILLTPVIILFWTWKRIVQITVSIFYKKLKLISFGIAEYMFYVTEDQEDFYLKPIRTILLCVILEGQLSPDEVRERVQKNVIEAQLPDGSLKFLRLQKIIFKKFGYGFLGLDLNFDISNHISESQVNLTEESINEFIIERSCAPFNPNSPMWEILLVPNYNGENKTMILLRFHHIIMDGFSLVHFVKAISDDPLVSFDEVLKLTQTTETMSSKPTLTFAENCANLYKRTIALPRRYLLERSARHNAPHFPNCPTAYNKVFHKIPLQNFKELKKRNKIAFTEAILTSMSLAFSEGCSLFKGAKWLTIKCTFPLPTTGKSIGNNFYLADVHLPIGSMTLEERLRKCQSAVQSTRTAVTPYVKGIIFTIGLNFPIVLFKKYFQNQIPFTLVSNTPGPAIPILAFGRYPLDLFYTIIPVSNPPFFVSIMSYNGDIIICLSSLSQIFDNKEIFLEFTNYFENGLDTLMTSTFSAVPTTEESTEVV